MFVKNDILCVACLIYIFAACERSHIAHVVTKEQTSETVVEKPDIELSLTDKLAAILAVKGVNTTSEIGATMLHYAAFRDETETLELLISQSSIDLNPITNEKKNSPLHVAALACADKGAAILLAQTETNDKLENSDGQTAYQVAISKGCDNPDAFKR